MGILEASNMLSRSVLLGLVASLVAAGSTNIPPMMGRQGAMGKMRGTWRGNVTHSPLGPQDIPTPYMSISEPDVHGNTYMRHLTEAQLFRVSGSGVAQYCFSYDTPDKPVTGSDEAPFELRHQDNLTVQFCWRGPRLPSHRRNCTGCDCAQWTLTLSEDSQTLRSQFQQSPPAIHMQIELQRTTAKTPTAAEVKQGWDCQLSNYTGFPNHTATHSSPSTTKAVNNPKKPSRSLCPFKQQGPTIETRTAVESINRTAGGPTRNCLIIGSPIVGPDRAKINFVQLEYTAEVIPCWPCRVSFQLLMSTPQNGSYISIGFKERYAAYYGFDKIREYDDYWGMSTSDQNRTELGGRIVTGHFAPSGRACVRHMVADAYVGSVADVPDDGRIFNTSLSSFPNPVLGSLTMLSFTAKLYAGKTEDDLKYQNRMFGEQRIMWARGAMGTAIEGADECSVGLNYHDGHRGLASLNFPGNGQPCQTSSRSPIT